MTAPEIFSPAPGNFRVNENGLVETLTGEILQGFQITNNTVGHHTDRCQPDRGSIPATTYHSVHSGRTVGRFRSWSIAGPGPGVYIQLSGPDIQLGGNTGHFKYPVREAEYGDQCLEFYHHLTRGNGLGSHRDRNPDI